LLRLQASALSLYQSHQRRSAFSAFAAKEFAMRAEVEKLADAIRQSLALLRRHL
jgi:hypothetical protein